MAGLTWNRKWVTTVSADVQSYSCACSSAGTVRYDFYRFPLVPFCEADIQNSEWPPRSHNTWRVNVTDLTALGELKPPRSHGTWRVKATETSRLLEG